MLNKKVVSLTQMAKRSRKSKKGGALSDYVTWPWNWGKKTETVPAVSEEIQPTGDASVPETPVTDSTTPSTSTSTSTTTTPTTGGRHTRRHRRGVKKTRSGKKSNRR